MNKKICVVGAGRWGKNHIRTLEALGTLGGIVESDEATLALFREKYPDVKTFTSVSEAIKENFDGYTIASSAETHYEIGKAILNSGKPVLIEKPFTLTTEDTHKLVELAKKMNVRLMVGHVMLFHPAIHKIKEEIDAGKIGKLQYIYSNRLNLGTVRTEENILWSFAVHDISIFQFLIGGVPEEVISRGGAYLQPHIHDTTMTTLRYPDNIVGHIFVSWLHPFKEHRIVVIGSKGMLSYEDSSTDKNILYYEKGIDWVQGEPIKRDGPTEVIPYQKDMPLTLEIKHFVENLDNPKAEICGPDNAIEVMDILEIATKSLLGDNPISSLDTVKNEKSDNKKKYFVHESSYVDDNVEIDEGTKVWHFSHVQSNSKIGKKVSIGQNVNIAGNVKIGNFVKIQNNVSVYEGVELEDYVFCGPSMVFTNVLDPRCKYPQCGSDFYHKTLVKEGASIGANATIVCGNTIGRHAFIGAGSTVTKDVKDFALMYGNPARQHGWVCECGEKLGDVKGETKCTRCGLEYKLEKDILIQK